MGAVHMDAKEYFLAAKSTLCILGAVLAFMLLSACGRSANGDDPDDSKREALRTLKLAALESCDAYKTYVTASLIEQYRPRGWSSQPVIYPSPSPQSAPAAPAAGGDSASTASSTPTHVTGTNNQEEGVDEPDIIKTDANGILYIARGDSLRIVAGHPPGALKELAALAAGGNVYDLFLDEGKQRAVLFAAHYEQPIPVGPPSPGSLIAMPIIYRPVQYIVSFVDVSSPEHPVLTSRWAFDGRPLDSRRIDARVHFVLTAPIELPVSLASDATFWQLYADYYSAPTADQASVAEQKIITAIRAAIAPMDAAKFLPSITIDTAGQINTRSLVGCGDVSAPKVVTHPTLLTVASFDTDGSNLSASAITADGATVYASPTHLYVTQSSGGWFGNDQTKPQTAIHQFSLSGNTPKYVATGVVDGWVLNSFSLSEYNGNLRVATNTTSWSNNVMSRTNDLFVMRDNGNGELTTRGAVRDFGNGESIFSARFLGARGFVVTFRQVDPLFAFDLSDPDHPKLAGELTIPGFSTYMHPLGDKHLLTLGRDGSAWGGATQLQIFDVSDLAHPKLAHAYTPVLPGSGYSYSEAAYDHHAFTFDEVNKVLAIPLSYSSSTDYFNGIAAFNVDLEKGISPIVQVDHADLANQAYCGPLPSITSCNYWYAAYPRRSVIMSDANGVTLYSISDAGVKATDLAPPNNTLGSVVFPAEPLPPTDVIAL